jgi:hypothetical protein
MVTWQICWGSALLSLSFIIGFFLLHHLKGTDISVIIFFMPGKWAQFMI